MKKEDYLAIFQMNLPDFVDICAYSINEILFQQDGDPKHTVKIVKEWLRAQKPRFKSNRKPVGKTKADTKLNPSE